MTNFIPQKKKSQSSTVVTHFKRNSTKTYRVFLNRRLTAVPHCVASDPGFWLTRRQVDHSIDFADFPTLAVASASQWSCILVTGRAWKVQRLGGKVFCPFQLRKVIRGWKDFSTTKWERCVFQFMFQYWKSLIYSWSIYFLEADPWGFCPIFPPKKKKVRKSTATHSHEGKVPPDGLDLIPQSFSGNLTL